MEKEVLIKGVFYGKTKCFPSLNNLLHEYQRSPYAGNDMKKKYMNIANRCIRLQLRGYKATKPIIIHYEFGEPIDGHYRDIGNILSCADKIISDSLVQCNVIEDDAPKYVRDISHKVVYVKKGEQPYIKITLKEL